MTLPQLLLVPQGRLWGQVLPGPGAFLEADPAACFLGVLPLQPRSGLPPQPFLVLSECFTVSSTVKVTNKGDRLLMGPCDPRLLCNCHLVQFPWLVYILIHY